LVGKRLQEVCPLQHSRSGVRRNTAEGQTGRVGWMTLLAPPEGHHHQSSVFHPGQMKGSKRGRTTQRKLLHSPWLSECHW
jgi:hypothetical protein